MKLHDTLIGLNLCRIRWDSGTEILAKKLNQKLSQQKNWVQNVFRFGYENSNTIRISENVEEWTKKNFFEQILPDSCIFKFVNRDHFCMLKCPFLLLESFFFNVRFRLYMESNSDQNSVTYQWAWAYHPKTRYTFLYV